MHRVLREVEEVQDCSSTPNNPRIRARIILRYSVNDEAQHHTAYLIVCLACHMTESGDARHEDPDTVVGREPATARVHLSSTEDAFEPLKEMFDNPLVELV